MFEIRYLNDEDDDVSLAVIPFAVGYVGVLKVCVNGMDTCPIPSSQLLGNMSESQSEMLKVSYRQLP